MSVALIIFLNTRWKAHSEETPKIILQRNVEHSINLSVIHERNIHRFKNTVIYGGWHWKTNWRVHPEFCEVQRSNAATRHRRGLGLSRSTRFGHRPARRGATSWRRRKQKGRVGGTSLSLPLSLSFWTVVGKRQEFLGPQAAGTSCPCPTGGVVASGGPRALILVGSILGLLSVRGVCPGPLLLSNGSQSKSISIPAARRRSRTGSFSLRKRFRARACSLNTSRLRVSGVYRYLSERPSYDPRPSISWSTFRLFIAVLERKKRVRQYVYNFYWPHWKFFRIDLSQLSKETFFLFWILKINNSPDFLHHKIIFFFHWNWKK